MTNSVDVVFDMLVIGGGINGVGIAHEAANQGLKVILCEKADFASGTSSKSSRMIHGGLRYLEQGALRLVYESLSEREALKKYMPHLVTTMSCVIPIHPQCRHGLLLKSGLSLYHLLSGSWDKLWPQTVHYDSKASVFQSHIKQALLYEDAWSDDSRLVITVALAAQEKGACLCPNSEVVSAVRCKLSKLWQVKVRQGEQLLNYTARSLVNAAGPYVDKVLQFCQPEMSTQLRLVQGSHIIVPRQYQNNLCCVLQASDKRIVFVAPYEFEYTMIGTTDVELTETVGVNYNALIPRASEVDYLLNVYADFFKTPLNSKNIIHSYSGVRPLIKTECGSPQANTRDYKLLLNDEHGLPLCSVIGGKLTTFRALAKKVLLQLQPFFKKKFKRSSMNYYYPGGDLNGSSLSNFKSLMHIYYPFIEPKLLNRYVSNYGARIQHLLNGIQCKGDLGKEVLPNLYEREIEFLKQTEWCGTVEDLLWRRTKLGLSYTNEQVHQLQKIW